MEVRITHALEPEVAAERIASIARENDIAFQSDGKGRSGSMSKKTPLGTVTASFRVEDSEVIVWIEDCPAFLPEGTVRRLLEESLREALSR